MDAAEAALPDPRVFRFSPGEKLLRGAMAHAAVGMALVGMDSRLAYVNAAFGSILGYATERCLGLRASEILAAVDTSELSDNLDRLAGGSAENFVLECCCQHASGRLAWVLVSGSVLESETGARPLYLIIQVTGIDRQKRAEAALAESEQRWGAALEAAGQAVWDHDHITGEKYYSPVWRRMRGLSSTDPVPSNVEEWLQRIHPDDRDRVIEYVKRQDAGELDDIAFEFRELHREGHWVWILSRGKPIEWQSDGRPARIIGIDTDITAIRAVEAELAAEKERLRVTLEAIGDGVISTDALGQVTFMNASAEQMVGWSPDDAKQQPVAKVFRLYNEVTGEPMASPTNALLGQSSASKLSTEGVLVKRDGEQLHVRSSAASIRLGDGSLVGTVMVFQDISQNRAVQRRLAYAASHDPLTGLPNKSAFETALGEACENSRRDRHDHALAFVDIDHFKAVNDGAGHAAGDAMLSEIAQLLRSTCRAGDLAARIGGDEFALLLLDCPIEAARARIEILVERVGSMHFVWGEKTYLVGASAGLTAVNPLSGDVASVLREADIACYRAKANGRGRVDVF
jgi:diguanylate cyclase (GGDEF)-like protein/PAS domain S-box-containing protein